MVQLKGWAEEGASSYTRFPLLSLPMPRERMGRVQDDQAIFSGGGYKMVAHSSLAAL